MKDFILATALFVCGTLNTSTIQLPAVPLKAVSRQSIKIWCLMRDLVDNKYDKHKNALSEAEAVENMDNLLCRIVRMRDALSHLDVNTLYEKKEISYFDSSLDCIESYTYDLVKQYPGSWSTVIQEQIFRTQDAYVQHVLPSITK